MDNNNNSNKSNWRFALNHFDTTIQLSMQESIEKSLNYRHDRGCMSQPYDSQ